jgi:hypothetical protein
MDAFFVRISLIIDYMGEIDLFNNAQTATIQRKQMSQAVVSSCFDLLSELM